MGTRILRWVIGVVILALIGAYLSMFIVREGEVAVVTRFGRVRRVKTEPGWYTKATWPIDAAHRFDSRRRVFNPTFVETLTRDQQNIIVWSYVVWAIDDQKPEDFVKSFKATTLGPERAAAEAESQLNNLVLNAQNALLGTIDLREIVSVNPQERKLAKIEQDILGMVKQSVEKEGLGIRLDEFGFKRLALPESTVKVVLDRMRTKREKVKNEFLGEGEKEARRINAETRLAVAQTTSEAKRREEAIRGRGDADRAKILLTAHARDPEFSRWLRDLEALRAVFGKRSVLVVDTRSPVVEALNEPLGPAGRATTRPSGPEALPGRRPAATGTAPRGAPE